MLVKSFTCGDMQNNAYLLWEANENKAVLIDAPYSSFRQVTEFAKEKNLSVCAVLLTHGHFDHIIDLQLFQNAGAKVYVHVADADKLCDPKKSLLGSRGYQNPTIPDIVLEKEEGEIQVDALHIKYLHTPGHSKGSVCYFVDDKYLFSGDTLFALGFGRTDFYDGDFAEMQTSLKKLFALHGSPVVMPGHGEFSTLDAERNFNPINY